MGTTTKTRAFMPLRNNYIFREKTFTELLRKMDALSNFTIGGVPIAKLEETVLIISNYAGVPLTAQRLSGVKQSLRQIPEAHGLHKTVVEAFLNVIRDLLTRD